MTEAESLQLITSMINKAKNRFTKRDIVSSLGLANINLLHYSVCCSLFFQKSKCILCMVFDMAGVDLSDILFAQKKKKQRLKLIQMRLSDLYGWCLYACIALLVFI